MSAAAPPEPPELQIRQLLGHYWVSQCVYVFVKLGIPDLLADGPLPPTELARRTGTHADSLRRLLRLLTNRGYLEERGDALALTPLGEALRTRPGSLRSFLLYNLAPELGSFWGVLERCVREGKPAPELATGRSFFENLADAPELARLFDDGMTSSAPTYFAALDAYDFSQVGLVVDVGGGKGQIIGELLRRNPHLRGMLFDEAHAVAAARERFAQMPELAARLELRAGSFFDAVPDEGDVYLMKNVIHDFDDAQATRILGNLRRAMKPGAKLLLLEAVVSRETARATLLGDIVMMVLHGGAERTEEEWRRLFTAAGFTLARAIPTAARLFFLEGTPA